MEKISVIIPVYNVAPYLEKCLDSVIRQTYVNLEIILVDDGSTDGSGNICESYAEKDKRIKVIHEKNGGLSFARNAAMKVMTGKYLTFVDGDDCIEKDMYEMLYNAISLNGSDISVCGRYEYNEDGSKRIYDFTEDRTVDKKEAVKLLLKDTSFGHMVWNKMYRKEMFEGTDFPEGKVFEDIAIMYGIIEKADKVSIVSKPYYHHLYRSGSISNEVCIDSYIDYLDAAENLIVHYKDSEYYKYSIINKFMINEYVWMKLSGIKDENEDVKSLIRQTRKEVIEHIDSIFYVNLKYKITAVAIAVCPHLFAWAINSKTMSALIWKMNKLLH